MASEPWETFEAEREHFLVELAAKEVLVLATSRSDVVTARSMSVVALGDKVYFQTSTRMEKYGQIAANPQVALCSGNLQIQGSARDIGPWAGHPDLLALYQTRHAKSYENYGSMPSQTVIEVTVERVKKWEYIGGSPFVFELDLEGRTVTRVPYDTQEAEFPRP